MLSFADQRMAVRPRTFVDWSSSESSDSDSSDDDNRRGKNPCARRWPPNPPLTWDESVSYVNELLGKDALALPKIPDVVVNQTSSPCSSRRTAVDEGSDSCITLHPVSPRRSIRIAKKVDKVRSQAAPSRTSNDATSDEESSQSQSASKTDSLFLLDTEGDHPGTSTSNPDENMFVIDTEALSAAATNLESNDRLDGRVRSTAEVKLSSQLDPGINVKDYLYFDIDPFGKSGDSMRRLSDDPRSRCIELKSGKLEELMKKSVITDDFEKKTAMPPAHISRHEEKRRRKAERESTKGSEWFNLPAAELTDEKKRDLEVLKMRDILDPKRHYKTNDTEQTPKYFEVGTIVEDPTDFYHARIPKKQRKKTLVDELMADAELQRYHKRKYNEIMAERAKSRKGAFRHKSMLKKKPKRERNKILRSQ